MYRGFNYHKKETKKDKECINTKLELKGENKTDSFVCTKLDIKIDEKWIIEIEDGISHIADAISQERQFIKTVGDVVPIEKVRRVSKASIVHLARHSSLITNLPKDGEILIPDKLYMEEKINDYTVYENRFIYTLLVLLQSFVTMRLDKITEVINSYEGNVNFSRHVENKTHKINFELKFIEERFDVLNETIDEEVFLLIQRIDMISREIISLLSCDLMKEVSRSPLVKPPLVKTNVLKGNKSFKGAVVLYDFINSYDEDGYTISDSKEKFNIINEIADEFAEIVGIVSMLTYKYSNKLSKELKNEFDLYEQNIIEKEKSELQSKIDRVKNKVENLDVSLEEYIVLLEKRNTTIEKELLEVVVYQQEIKELKLEVAKLNDFLLEEEQNIKMLKEEIHSNKNEISNLNFKNEEEVNCNKGNLKELKENYDNEKEVEINKINEEFSEKEKKLLIEIEELKQNVTKQTNDKNFALAQLLAIRLENNIKTDVDDYTSKDRFKELERQYFVFEQFFSEEWKKTKKKIRKQYLSK